MVGSDVFLSVMQAISREIAGLGLRSGNFGHGGRPGHRGGSAPKGGIQVGITSHRPEVGFVPAHLSEFKKALGDTPVKGLTVGMGRGGWQGGGEPTFVTRYKGNGEARKALVGFAKKYNQDGVLFQQYTSHDDPDAQPQVRFRFGHLSKSQRATVEQVMATKSVDMGGWTWARNGKGHTLILTCIPQWGGERGAHLRKCARLKLELTQRGFSHGTSVHAVKVEAWSRDGGDYDRIIGS